MVRFRDLVKNFTGDILVWKYLIGLFNRVAGIAE
jgi:hypothetical protein